jgi:hypothetical protein
MTPSAARKLPLVFVRPGARQSSRVKRQNVLFAVPYLFSTALLEALYGAGVL